MAEAKKPFRILGLADLHDRIERLEPLRQIDADLIVFCGDLHNAGSNEMSQPAALALAGLGLPVLIVPGNMDHRDVVPDLWNEAGLRMLHRTSFRFADLGFLGMGGIVAKDPRRLGDPARYYHRDEDVYETLAKSHQDISDARIRIAVVHQPPRGAQDTLYNGESSGSVSLRRFIEEYQPDLLLCGHIHEARGQCRIGSTRVVNVGELRQGFGALIEIGEKITVDWIDAEEDDRALRDEIERGIGGVQALRKVVQDGGLKNRKKVTEEMDELISPAFEPYFLANAALHLLAECKRCGRCCREEKTIAVSMEDCRRIASHLGLSLKRFMMDYTRPHELKGENVGNARMMKKAQGMPCPFFDSALPGCRIQSVKPQVCTAVFYLSKMNLLICEEQKKLSTFPKCPADMELRARIADFSRLLEEDSEAKEELKRLFSFARPEAELFRLLLRLKGMEIYFGRKRAALLARRLGLARMPEDEEIKPSAFLYAVNLLGDGDGIDKELS